MDGLPLGSMRQPVEVELPVAKPLFPWPMKSCLTFAGLIKAVGTSMVDLFVQQFEAQLATHAGGGSVATVANATIGLVLALLDL